MDPTDLTADELFALANLLRHMIAADGEVSEEEAAELTEIGLELSEDRFLAAWEKAGDNNVSKEQALVLARTLVKRPEARELMVTMLVDLANVDGMDIAEMDLVVDLREAWGM